MISELYDLLDRISYLFGDVYVREAIEEYAHSRYAGEWKLKQVAEKVDYTKIDANFDREVL